MALGAHRGGEGRGHIVLPRTQLVNAAKPILGHKSREELRKPWVAAEVIDMMEEIRKWKSVHLDEGCRNMNH